MANIYQILGIEGKDDLSNSLVNQVAACQALDETHLERLTWMLGIKIPKNYGVFDKKGKLTPEGVNFTYAYAMAVQALSDKKLTPSEAADWLQRPCDMLKGREPFSLLRSYPGHEYVLTAISRL